MAIKVLKDEYLRRDSESLASVKNEVFVLKSLQHPGIIKLLDFGDSGEVVKPSTRVIPDLVFLTMEYVSGGLLFDLC